MKKGDSVIVKRSQETERLDIVGRQGYVEYADILGNLYVRIPGYPNPFVLATHEVEEVKRAIPD